MINEGRGISDINKIQTNKIYDLFKIVKFKNNVDYLFDNINIKINFYINNKYKSDFKLANNKYVLNLGFPEHYNELKCKETIAHELNHLIEIKSIIGKNKPYPMYDKIKKSLIDFNPKTTELQFLKHAIYKILDNEINAKNAQTYIYLKHFNINNLDLLKQNLENYNVRQEYIDLKNYDENKLISDIRNNKNSYNELIKFNDILINKNVDDFLIFLYDINYIEKYIKNWFKLIRINCNKLLKKQENIIKEVIEDTNYTTNYDVNESIITKFNDYLKK